MHIGLSGAAARTGKLWIKIIEIIVENRILGAFKNKHQKESRDNDNEIR